MPPSRRFGRSRFTLILLVLASLTVLTLDKTPPELAADIMEQGIVLAGGGALLHGLSHRLEHETGMPIVIADNPLHCVAIGSGQSLEEFEALKGVLFSSNPQT